MLNLFALLAAQKLILDIVARGLVLQRLEVVGGVLLHKLAVLVGRVLEPNVGVRHILLVKDRRLELVRVLHAALGAALNREHVLRLELLLFSLNRLEHLGLDLRRLRLQLRLLVLGLFWRCHGSHFLLFLRWSLFHWSFLLLLIDAIFGLFGTLSLIFGSLGGLLVLALALVFLVVGELLLVE